MIEPVALALLGEPSQRLRHDSEWRYRRKGSLAVHVDGPRRGTWRDHEAGKGGGVLALVEHVEGIGRAEALQWLRDHGLLHSDGAAPNPPPAPRPPARAAPDRNTVDHARQLWDRSREVPEDPTHPARRWMARRHLWRPGLPLPPSVRWLSRPRGYAVGSVIAAFAPPGSRELSGVHLVHVDADGNKSLDRDHEDGGQTKRSHGVLSGAVCVVGQPVTDGALSLCEGLADALSLASRLWAPAVFTSGTSGFHDDGVAKWLTTFGNVDVWPDTEQKDDGAGLLAARLVAQKIVNMGGSASIQHVGRGEDPGAAGVPFAPLDLQAVEEFRQDLIAEGRPDWEAMRLATTLMLKLATTPPRQTSFAGQGREH